MAFEESLPVAGLRPADYNPRLIEPEAIERLKASILEVGFVKPIVMRADGLLIAGHQRTKAAQALGIDRVPGHVIDVQGTADETRFNQLHNGCEIDLHEALVQVPPGAPGTWAVHRSATVPDRLGAGASERQETMRLLTKYGPFGGCVATPSGEVVAGQTYVWCCVRTGQSIHVRYVEEGKAEAVRTHLSGEYGRYSYAHLPKTTWAQSLAQMWRLEGKGNLKSSLYERCVLPNLKPGERVLDFGCGKGAYVRLLKERGFDACGIEFYARNDFAIDAPKVHRDMDVLFAELAQRGRFDVVVCDSVLNSVDSSQAERDVLACVNALCRMGGRIYFSGRPLERHELLARSETIRDHRRYIEFLDADGFTAIYRHGSWHYQKFHDRAMVEAFAERYVGHGCRLTCSDRATAPKAHLTGTSWQCQGVKTVEVDHNEQEAAIAREFDLPLPSGRYGRAEDALTAFRSALAAGT